MSHLHKLNSLINYYAYFCKRIPARYCPCGEIKINIMHQQPSSKVDDVGLSVCQAVFHKATGVRHIHGWYHRNNSGFLAKSPSLRRRHSSPEERTHCGHFNNICESWVTRCSNPVTGVLQNGCRLSFKLGSTIIEPAAVVRILCVYMDNEFSEHRQGGSDMLLSSSQTTLLYLFGRHRQRCDSSTRLLYRG